MTGASFKVDDRELLERLALMRRRGESMSPALRAWGEQLLISHRERFAQQVGPDGQPWAPLSPAYRAEKRRNVDKVLTLDGYLRGTLRYLAGDQGLTFGTDRVYGAVQQFGARKGQSGTTRAGAPIPWGDIPARPFLGLSDNDMAAGMKIIGDYVMGR